MTKPKKPSLESEIREIVCRGSYHKSYDLLDLRERMLVDDDTNAILSAVEGIVVVDEKLCEAIHKAYCQYCIDVKGKEYWTKGDYSKLTDEVKEADRYTARAVIKEIREKVKK